MGSQELIRQEEGFFLLRSSWVCLLSSIYAAYRDYWNLVPVSAGVLITSWIYWSDPNTLWKRRLDMTYVISSFMYQNWMAWNAEYVLPYYSLSAITCACYPISNYLFRTGYRWGSIYTHAVMHTLACVCNLILYSGCLSDCNLKKH